MFPELAERLRASSVEVEAGGRSIGSGVVWTADGTIVTNAHVVQTDRPLVKLRGGERFEAQVVRRDPKRDLAVLRIRPPHDLPAVELADSSRLRPGQMVAAVGNPFGVVGAVSTGIVHACGGDWIEADVRLAPGNSGGMLADARGRLVGINTMVSRGLALAVPANRAAAFVRGENADRPVLGITMQPVMVENRRWLVLVEIARGSLAEQAGLLIGDVLLISPSQLRTALESRGTFPLRFLRANQVRQITIALDATLATPA
jgi:serine protease Do